MLGGYINTICNMLAPRMVPAQVLLGCGWGGELWMRVGACRGSSLTPFARAAHPPLRNRACHLTLHHMQLKGQAAALMALCYQSAHIVGLALATLLVYLLYGTIDVEG